MKKGTRQIRFCKFGCGNQVVEKYSKSGRFMGYSKTCSECNPRKWTEERKIEFSKIIGGMNHPGSLPLFTRRQHTPNKSGKPYWQIKISESGRWKFEHRYIMEQQLGRQLETGEHVHHINGDTLDNRPENLIVMSAHDHGVMSGTMLRKENRGLWEHRSHKCPICGANHDWPS
jgi:hypothetical protein